MKFVRTFPKNSTTSERLGNTDLRAGLPIGYIGFKPRASRSKGASKLEAPTNCDKLRIEYIAGI